VNKAAADGATALHAASQNGHAAVVCALVRAGADVNAASGNGCTPLFRACENGQIGCVEALLHSGADLNLMCDNQTALAVAASNGHSDIVALMRHASVPKRARVEDGKR
jgi:ankyrin repeat protein